MSEHDRAPLTIAIDGPSGSGKSTVARHVAARLGLAYLDTGAMYRALTWHCIHAGIDLADTEACAAAARTLAMELSDDPMDAKVIVSGVDVTTAIRRPEISSVVSQIATNIPVRQALKARQQEIIASARRQHGGVVAEGRDITTVVCPEAEVRVLLTASEEARLARRSAELVGRATPVSDAEVRDQVLRRDRQDATVSQFFEAAPGVSVVDSSALNLEETIDAVLALVPSAPDVA